MTSLRDLSSVLWREREALRILVGRLDEDPAAAEASSLLRSLSSLELHRAVTAREAAAELGLVGEPTLAEIVDRSPADWSLVLAEHRSVLRSLAGEVAARCAVTDLAGEGHPSPLGRGVQTSLLDFLA